LSFHPKRLVLLLADLADFFGCKTVLNSHRKTSTICSIPFSPSGEDFLSPRKG
jgi:hypothetical protein